MISNSANDNNINIYHVTSKFIIDNDYIPSWNMVLYNNTNVSMSTFLSDINTSIPVENYTGSEINESNVCYHYKRQNPNVDNLLKSLIKKSLWNSEIDIYFINLVKENIIASNYYKPYKNI